MHVLPATSFITARSELRKVLFLAPSVCVFLFVYEIYRESLNGFGPNSHGRRVWPLAQMSLKVKVKGQGHQGQKWYFSALSEEQMILSGSCNTRVFFLTVYRIPAISRADVVAHMREREQKKLLRFSMVC